MLQLLQPTAGLNAHDRAAARVGLDAENLVELAHTDKRAAVIDEGRRHRQHGARRIDRRREARDVAHDRLHVGVADRLDIDGGPRRAMAAPVGIALGLGDDETLDETSLLGDAMIVMRHGVPRLR